MSAMSWPANLATAVMVVIFVALYFYGWPWQWGKKSCGCGHSKCEKRCEKKNKDRGAPK